MELRDAILGLKDSMRDNGIRPEKGLGEELFLFSSTLAPVINVDLLITDRDGRVLLSWREDSFHSPGWHVPGTCVRFRETFAESIRRCAREELGVEVTFNSEPIKIYELIRESDRDERAHFITLVFACRLAREDFVFPEERSIRRFREMPENMTSAQICYRQDWEILLKKLRKHNHEICQLSVSGAGGQ